MFDDQSRNQVHRILEYFSSLAQVGHQISSSDQIGRTLSSTISAIVSAFELEQAVFLAADTPSGRFSPAVTVNVQDESRESIEFPVPILDDLSRPPQFRPARQLAGDLVDRFSARFDQWTWSNSGGVVSLVCSGELVGLFAFGRTVGHLPLSSMDTDLLCGMCQNVSIYLHNQVVLTRLAARERELQQLYQRTREIYRQAVMAFLNAIDIKDGYTKAHSLRVAKMSSALAREMGFNDHEVEGVYFAGLLHDIGKILVDKQVLTKPGSLDLTEYAEMSQHSELGAEIVSSIRFPWENLIPTIRHHHDRIDSLQIDSKRRRRLSIAINIIGLTDAFDAMTSDRPYRRALTLHETIAEIVGCLGGQFDPEATRLFLKILDRDVARPPAERSIITKELRNGNRERARRAIADALGHIEQSLGIATPC